MSKNFFFTTKYHALEVWLWQCRFLWFYDIFFLIMLQTCCSSISNGVYFIYFCFYITHSHLYAIYPQKPIQIQSQFNLLLWITIFQYLWFTILHCLFVLINVLWWNKYIYTCIWINFGFCGWIAYKWLCQNK